MEHKIKYRVKRAVYPARVDKERWECSCGKQGEFTTAKAAQAGGRFHLRMQITFK